MTRDRAYYEQLLTNSNVVAYLNAISRVEAPTYYTNFGGSTIVPTSPDHPVNIVCQNLHQMKSYVIITNWVVMM